MIYMLMDDASRQNQLMLQRLSSSPTAVPIDSEMGDLRFDALGGEPSLSYLRYDVPLERKGIEQLNVARIDVDLESMRDIDSAKSAAELYRLGEGVAGKLIHAVHFPRVFDERVSEHILFHCVGK